MQGTAPALEIAEAWLKQAKWPLYENTRNRRAIGTGARFLFYIAGRNEHRQSFIAQASAARIDLPTRADCDLSAYFLMNKPHSIIEMIDVDWFDPPISIRPFIGNLSIVKNAGSKWGAALVGGSRRLTEEDYKRVTQAR